MLHSCVTFLSKYLAIDNWRAADTEHGALMVWRPTSRLANIRELEIEYSKGYGENARERGIASPAGSNWRRVGRRTPAWQQRWSKSSAGMLSSPTSFSCASNNLEFHLQFQPNLTPLRSGAQTKPLSIAPTPASSRSEAPETPMPAVHDVSGLKKYFREGSVRGSVFNLCSATLGAGALALPYAFSSAGLCLGVSDQRFPSPTHPFPHLASNIPR